jgi:hypothetical protein
MKRRLLTAAEMEYINKNYPISSCKDVAMHLNMPQFKVYNYVWRIGLKKDPEFRANQLKVEAKKLSKLGRYNRFKKGHEPFNKGLKMNAELYEKCKPTMFKKGSKPHNFKPDGSERIDKDGYTMIKFNGKYHHKQRFIYEQHHEIKLPKNYAVVFIDGNKQNFMIDNLLAVSRGKLMLHNTIHNYPAEIKSTMKILSKLKKQINAKKQN